MEMDKMCAGTEVRQGGSVSTVWPPAPRCGAGLLVIIIIIFLIIIFVIIIIIILIIFVGLGRPLAGWAKVDRWMGIIWGCFY